MDLDILPHNLDLEYRSSKTARRLRIAVYCDSRIVVTAPLGFQPGLVEKFVKEKTQWILDKLEYFKKYPQPLLSKKGKRDFVKHKTAALGLAQQLVHKINLSYGFSYNRINIKNQKTRWGSCSRRGNLNFNYRIIFLPLRLAEYLVAHELCHLKEFNHSRRFWGLVALTIPDYRVLRQELKKHL